MRTGVQTITGPTLTRIKLPHHLQPAIHGNVHVRSQRGDAVFQLLQAGNALPGFQPVVGIVSTHGLIPD